MSEPVSASSTVFATRENAVGNTMFAALSVPPMPTPPATTRAPVVVEVEAVLLVIDTSPDDTILVNVPTDVTLGCAAVASVPVIDPAVIKLPAYKSPAIPTPPVTRRAPVPVDEDTVLFVTISAPDDVKPESVPKDVTFGCAAVERVPASVTPVTVPAVVKLPPVMVPETVKDDSVPTDVTLGCAAVARVPVIEPAVITLPAYKAPAIPTPPVTRSAPVVVDVAASVAVMDVTPVNVGVLITATISFASEMLDPAVNDVPPSKSPLE